MRSVFMGARSSFAVAYHPQVNHVTAASAKLDFAMLGVLQL